MNLNGHKLFENYILCKFTKDFKSLTTRFIDQSKNVLINYTNRVSNNKFYIKYYYDTYKLHYNNTVQQKLKPNYALEIQFKAL